MHTHIYTYKCGVVNNMSNNDKDCEGNNIGRGNGDNNNNYDNMVTKGAQDKTLLQLMINNKIR
jgi:hypothetical protein